MDQHLIFAPMGSLAFLTFGVLTLIPLRRFRAGAAGQIVSDDFKLGESANVPGHVSIPNRNYMNLLELPMLFYVGSLMFYVTSRVDTLVLGLAWLYVALRIVHSIIHLTYNNVMHRLGPFALSNLVLIAYWLIFFLRA
ncbi:MAG: MAPEG family protein [Phenylobacterium sp.]